MKMKMKTGISAFVAGSALFITNSAMAAGDDKAGLPQLDIATWPSQLFWLVVTFGVGYIIMSRV